MKNYWRKLNEILFKLIHIINAFFLVLILFGLVISSDLRERYRLLVEAFLDAGWLGLTTVLIFIYLLRKVPNTISKFLKAKGFNKTFWDDL